MLDTEPDYDAVYLEEHPELMTEGGRLAAELASRVEVPVRRPTSPPSGQVLLVGRSAGRKPWRGPR